PRPEGPNQSSRLLCLMRQAELRSLPCLWGLPEAELVETSCIARGDAVCGYDLSWSAERRAYTPLGALAGAVACGAAIGLLGQSFGGIASAAAAGLGAAWGGSLGYFVQRTRSDRQART